MRQESVRNPSHLILVRTGLLRLGVEPQPRVGGRLWPLQKILRTLNFKDLNYKNWTCPATLA
jgi:hypothetical protein